MPPMIRRAKTASAKTAAWEAFKRSTHYAALISHADAPAAALAAHGSTKSPAKASGAKAKPAYSLDAIIGKVIAGVAAATGDTRKPNERVVYTYPGGMSDDKEVIRRCINLQFIPWEPLAPGDIGDQMTIRQLAQFIFNRQ